MIALVIWIVIGGLICWGVTYLPIHRGFKIAIMVVVIVCLAVYVLDAINVLPARDVPVPQVPR